MGINYTIGSWSGARRATIKDEIYIKLHLDQLSKLKTTQISQISIGHPENSKIPKTYSDYINEIKNINDIPVVVYPMSNTGSSYSQYMRIYQECRDKFEYYLFIEDDYAPVLDNFDSILLERFQFLRQKFNCGYLGSLIFTEQKTHHLSVSNGITSAEVLENGLKKKIPYHVHGNGAQSQIVFSQFFLKAGFNLGSYIDKFQVPFYNLARKILIYGNPKLPSIISPLQMIGRNYRQVRASKKYETYNYLIKGNNLTVRATT